jgi:hypothetical protein
MLNTKQTLKVLKFFAQQINDWTLLNVANYKDEGVVDIRSYDVACLCKEYAKLLNKSKCDEQFKITVQDVATAFDNLDTEFRECVEEEFYKLKIF